MALRMHLYLFFSLSYHLKFSSFDPAITQKLRYFSTDLVLFFLKEPWEVIFGNGMHFYYCKLF